MICKKCGNFTHDVELYCKMCGADLDLYSDKVKKVDFLLPEEERGIKEIFREEKKEEPPVTTTEITPEAEEMLSFKPKKLEEEEEER